MAIVACLLFLPAPTSGQDFDPTPTPGVDHLVPWEVNCDNEDRSDGYRMPSWAKNFCVPGIVTWDAWMCGSPGSFTGVMSSYSEGVMERVAERFGVKDGNWKRAGYKGGVALMSCADVGKTVSLTLPGRDREGPFLVVDCSRRRDMFYHVVHMGLAVEVDHQTAKRWGTYVAGYIEVNNGGVSYRSWWMKHYMAFETPEGWPPTPTSSPTITPTIIPTRTPTPTNTDLPTPKIYATVTSTSVPVELYQSIEEKNEMMQTEEFILLFASLIAGVVGMPITKYFKEKLNLDSTSSACLSVAIAGVMAIVAMVATGALGMADFSWERLPATLAAAWGFGVIAYNAITGKRKE